MKTISKKDWGDPKFQEIRKQEQEAKKQILKKAKNFRIKNTRELREIQKELDKKFRPSKIYKSISEAIRNLNNKITDSKLNNILNDKLDKLNETIKSVPDKIKHSIEKRKIKKENKEQERKIKKRKEYLEKLTKWMSSEIFIKKEIKNGIRKIMN
jgi:hypothetical protein